MNFKKRGELKRLMIVAIFMLFCFALYMVFAQESTTTPSITLIILNDTTDRDYEGYQLLDMDDDSYLTEEDIYLKLEEINNQISGANTYLTYLNDVYNFSFTLTPITTSTLVKNSANTDELSPYLELTSVELNNLAEEIDLIENQVGLLAKTDSSSSPILEYFERLDYEIYLVSWYSDRR